MVEFRPQIRYAGTKEILVKVAIMQNKRRLTGAQITGWIIWWLVTIVIVLIMLWLNIGGKHSWVNNTMGIAFGIAYIVQQVVMIFALKRLHKDDNYVWPIVSLVMGVLGSFLYLIPGIWALIVNNNARNHRQRPINQ